MRRFVDALRRAESASGKKVAYIGGIDLSHVGPEFGDPDPLDAATLDHVRTLRHRRCSTTPRRTTRPAGSTRRPRSAIAGASADWRPPTRCSTPSGPARGRLLQYDQAVDDRRTCCVSFASLAFEAATRRCRRPDSDSEVRNSA